MSDFGTGKTTLIRTKAKQLLRERRPVIIVTFEDRESTEESLLTVQLKAEFGDIVHSIRGSGEIMTSFMHVFFLFSRNYHYDCKCNRTLCLKCALCNFSDWLTALHLNFKLVFQDVSKLCLDVLVTETNENSKAYCSEKF